jgi:hypothetical protein
MASDISDVSEAIPFNRAEMKRFALTRARTRERGGYSYCYSDIRGFQQMAVLVIPNAAMLTVQWSSPAGTFSNVLGFVGSPALPTIDQTLAEGLHTDWGSAMAGSGLASLLSDTVIFERVKIRDISGPSRPEFVSTGTPVAGAGVGDILPLSLAAVVTLRTAVASKSGRGRVYFTGFTEAQNDATGRTAAAVNTAIVAQISTFGSATNARGLAIAVLSRPADAVTIPAVSRPARTGQANRITGIVARNTKWESQRRRTGRE